MEFKTADFVADFFDEVPDFRQRAEVGGDAEIRLLLQHRAEQPRDRRGRTQIRRRKPSLQRKASDRSRFSF